jgi:subtilase family serine protease
VNSVGVPQLQASGANIAIASFICQHAGTYAFMARADSTSAIAERNETNNELETTFVCVN